MGRIKDLTGHRYGELTVIRYAGLYQNRYAAWECRCDCGRVKVIPGYVMTRGAVKTCGCKRYARAAWSRRLPPGVAAMNSAYTTYRISAQKRGLEFTVSKEEFAALVVKPCHYCGSASGIFYGRSNNTRTAHNGLDRVDNSKGYTIPNVVPCCKACNYMKRTMNVSDFISQAIRIARYSD
jgi:hypothetical protein